jgi:dolichyl-phosphate-mannose--protein O-mannosyl transferase
MGNPVTWLVSLLGVVFATALVLVDWLLRILPAERRHWLYAFVLLYWAYMIPMMFIERVMYLYHYFPPLVTGVILFALAGRQAQTISLNVKRIALVGLVVLVIIAFWHYKPLTYYELITGPEFRQRILFPVWDLRCVGC